MIIESVCKYCKAPVHLDFQDAPEEFITSLSGLEACNRCADLRVNGRILGFQIKSICFSLRPGMDVTEKMKDDARAALEELTQKYFRLVANWTDNPEFEFAWTKTVVDQLLEFPLEYPAVLKSIWGLANNTKRLL